MIGYNLDLNLDCKEVKLFSELDYNCEKIALNFPFLPFPQIKIDGFLFVVVHDTPVSID